MSLKWEVGLFVVHLISIFFAAFSAVPDGIEEIVAATCVVLFSSLSRAADALRTIRLLAVIKFEKKALIEVRQGGVSSKGLYVKYMYVSLLVILRNGCCENWLKWCLQYFQARRSPSESSFLKVFHRLSRAVRRPPPMYFVHDVLKGRFRCIKCRTVITWINWLSIIFDMRDIKLTGLIAHKAF